MAQVPWSAEQKEAFVRMQYAAQKQHYAAEFPQASHDIIYIDETAVGRLYLDRREDALHILDITVLPQHRGQGPGHCCCAGFSMRRASSGSRSPSMWKLQSLTAPLRTPWLPERP